MSTVVIQKRQGKKGMSYRVQFRDPNTGKKKHFKTLRRLRDAHQAAHELRSILDLGRMPKKIRRFNPLTFTQVANSLRDEWKSRLIRKEIGEKTHYEYNVWLGSLEKTFGKRLLCKITLDDILTYRDGQVERNSVISANRYLSVIKSLFAHGVKMNAVLENPAKDIALLSEKTHERKRFLFPGELNRVIQACQKVRAKFYLPAVIYLGGEHGASKQEILFLKWSDIDFDFEGKGLIHFFRNKNKRERTEFLMPRTKKALLKWRDHLERKRQKTKITAPKSDRVFCRIDGTPISRFDKSWHRVLELAGIKDFHFHDLRHTFCSSLLLSGAGLKDVKEMIGHSDLSMTDRYSHLSMKHNLAKQIQLAEYYANGAAD